MKVSDNHKKCIKFSIKCQTGSKVCGGITPNTPCNERRLEPGRFTIQLWALRFSCWNCAAGVGGRGPGASRRLSVPPRCHPRRSRSSRSAPAQVRTTTPVIYAKDTRPIATIFTAAIYGELLFFKARFCWFFRVWLVRFVVSCWVCFIFMVCVEMRYYCVVCVDHFTALFRLK